MCGREYTGETGRTLGVRIREHKYNLRQGHFDKSKFEEGQKFDWTHACIFCFESNAIYRKYK
jgi:hypothetical protein